MTSNLPYLYDDQRSPRIFLITFLPDKCSKFYVPRKNPRDPDFDLQLISRDCLRCGQPILKCSDWSLIGPGQGSYFCTNCHSHFFSMPDEELEKMVKEVRIVEDDMAKSFRNKIANEKNNPCGYEVYCFRFGDDGDIRSEDDIPPIICPNTRKLRRFDI